jgi:hypothetical protein
MGAASLSHDLITRHGRAPPSLPLHSEGCRTPILAILERHVERTLGGSSLGWIGQAVRGLGYVIIFHIFHLVKSFFTTYNHFSRVLPS